MNARMIIPVIVLMALMLTAAPAFAGQMAKGESGERTMHTTHRKAEAPDRPTFEGQGWTCPWCGHRMGHQEKLRGTQALGWNTGYQPRPDAATDIEPLTTDQAKLLVENYIRQTNNPNLKVGEVTEKDGYYMAEILTTKGSLVDRVDVHKQMGWIRSAYRR